MHTIEVDFDVFKAITARRNSEEVTPNDVLRDLFGLEKKHREDATKKMNTGKDWVTKGVTFSDGSEFRANYKGRNYYAKVENGALVYDGRKFSSPSSAAISITENSVNGWIFWECKQPGNEYWELIKNFRK